MRVEEKVRKGGNEGGGGGGGVTKLTLHGRKSKNMPQRNIGNRKKEEEMLKKA